MATPRAHIGSEVGGAQRIKQSHPAAQRFVKSYREIVALYTERLLSVPGK